jgi:hypothetical protein
MLDICCRCVGVAGGGGGGGGGEVRTKLSQAATTNIGVLSLSRCIKA